MCIITATVEKVSGTNIFVCALDDGRQIIIYSNSVETPVINNTMVLPVPNPDSVKFVNLKHYEHFFKDCADSFSTPRNDHYGMRSALCSISPKESTLPVFDVGSYNVSIVPTINEFNRLNPDYFTIDPTIPHVIERNYDSSFGYLVCKLRRGQHSYHPLAYTHQVHKDRLLFVPTLHIHPDGTYSRDVEPYGDWDHSIYTVETDMEDDGVRRQFDGWSLKWDKLPQELHWIQKYRGHKWTCNGHKKNRDIWLRNFHDFHPPEHRIRYQEGDETRTDFQFFDKSGIARLQRHFRRGGL
jgi:hypothetical protein